MRQSTINSAKGFSLVELIAVLVILGLLSTIGISFVVKTTQSYQETQTISKLTMTARQSVERMSRQLRAALPYSVRLLNGGQCIEFMPIASGGFYVNSVADTKNNAVAQSTISVAPHQIDFGMASFISIGAMSANEIYGGSGGSIASVNSRNVTSIVLSSAKTWLRNSPNKRFYLLNAPQAFCVDNNQLKYFPTVSLSASTIDMSNGFDLLADNVSAAVPFNLTSASDNRNAIVQINLEFSENGRQVNFNQQVMIRNVP